MGWLFNLPVATWRRLLLIGQGLAALPPLIWAGLLALLGRGGTVTSRLTAALGTPRNLRRGFAILRLFQPNLVIGKQVITSYPNKGTAVVTRREDVIDVLTRDDDFGVVYGPRMEMITAGENFFLGMQDTPRYTRDVSNMRLVVRRDDVPLRVKPILDDVSRDLVDRARGRIDVPRQLTQPAAARLLADYFGTPGPTETVIAEWTTTLFWYLFLDLQADPAFDARAEAEAAAFREWMDAHMAARKAIAAQPDDVLGRCFAMQAGGAPGMRDIDIRNNLIGLLIGELPTLSAAANLALDELLDRPKIFAEACAAARNDDDDRLAAYIFEALRFRPLNPLIYRRAMRDVWVATGRLRARKVREGTMVMASNLSAMYDPIAIPDPGSFRIDRPWDTYILWGYGMHSCFGAHINRAALPAMLKPLLARPNLRRASGAAGQIDKAGTPFPVHLELEFDA